MAYVTVPKDLTKIKSKVMFNLTKRQLDVYKRQGNGNPHAHILLTMRAMDENGKWLPKSRKVYDLSLIHI